MPIEKQIERMVRETRGRCYNERQSIAASVGQFIGDRLHDGDWSELTADDREEVSELATRLHARMELVSSANLLEALVLDAKNARSRTIRLPDGAARVQEAIDELLADRSMPRRDFVYVVWQRRPVHYWYVGEGNRSRLKLKSHGSLGYAVGKGATTLSLLFPRDSTKPTLRRVESALLRLVTEKQGRPPPLNEKMGSPPVYMTDDMDDAAALRLFLRSVADAL